MRVIGWNVLYAALLSNLDRRDGDGARACLHALGGLMGEW
jgi:hypothetical protein